jgi:hypothetical protein
MPYETDCPLTMFTVNVALYDVNGPMPPEKSAPKAVTPAGSKMLTGMLESKFHRYWPVPGIGYIPLVGLVMNKRPPKLVKETPETFTDDSPMENKLDGGTPSNVIVVLEASAPLNAERDE